VKSSPLVVTSLLCLALSLIAAGCVRYTGHTESCRTSQVFGSVENMTCSGTAEIVRGEGPLTFGDDDDEFGGDYRFEMTASVEQGRMDIYASTVDGGRKGGEVSPDNPLKIEAVRRSPGGVTVKVKGGEDAEVRGLRYELTIERVG
jgi:hypothetical protein